MDDKKAIGRPTDYRPEMDEQAFKLCLMGATDEQLADFFDVSAATIYTWKKVHPSFLEATKNGKCQADAEIASSLYHRAKGYVAKKTVTANNMGIITDVKVVDEYVGPDTTAAIFWLKNRQPKYWRDKQEIEATVTEVKTLNDFYSDTDTQSGA